MKHQRRFLLGAATVLAFGCGDDGASDEGAGTTGGTEATTAETSDVTAADGGSTNGMMTTGFDDDSAGDPTAGDPNCPYDPVLESVPPALELLATGFDAPVLALGHPTQPERLFVVERAGRVKILEPGQTQAPEASFLELDVARLHSEQGLLGFAFHPNYPDDPRVYVSYNPQGGDEHPPTRVEEYTVGAGEVVDYASARIVIEAGQPAQNHNGGMIAFGPDGYLYFSTGDGGGAGNEYGTARDPQSILAKILRIGVDADGTPDEVRTCETCDAVGPFDYTIPSDNPFADGEAAAPEVYALGMRNPWRFSFDPETGTLYVADVGQDAWEEVNVVEAGRDYGWHLMEGNHCFADDGCDESAGPNEVNADGLTAPIAEYASDGEDRCSVTGLGLYRSCETPDWDGLYFYGDFCTGEIFAVHWDGTNAETFDVVGQLPDSESPLGGGSNAHGDVFVTSVVVDFTGEFGDGRVYRFAPQR